jgi:YVTN family beta-propeller protein
LPVGGGPDALAVSNGRVSVAAGKDGRVSSFDGRSVAALPRTAAVTVVTYVKVGTSPIGLLDAAGSMWVANADDGTVTRIDEQTLRPTATVRVGGSPWFLATSQGQIFVGVQDIERLVRIDPRTNRVTGNVAVDPDPVGVASVAGQIWVTSPSSDRIDIVDPKDLRVLARRSASGRPLRLSVTPRSVLVGAASAGDLLFLDPATSSVTARLPLGPLTAGTVAWQQDQGWAVVGQTGEVVKIDLRARTAGSRRHVADGLTDVVLYEAQLWLTSTATDTIYRVDPATLRVTGSVKVGSNPQTMTSGDGDLWIASTRDGYVERVETLDPTATG